MASTVDEYQELMANEVYVEIDKLQDIAKHGIPDEVRGEVWKYLLGVQDPDKSKEMSSAQSRAIQYREFVKEYADISKRLKGEISRYQASVEKVNEPKSCNVMFEHVICAYLNNRRGLEYNQGLVYLCAPFVYTHKVEEEMYYSFESLMNLLNNYFDRESQTERMAKIIMLFRMTQPDLYNYFEEEEVDLNTWISDWLSRLLSKELPLSCVLRLWDTYFSVPEGLELHIYVCLAILRYFKDQLDDLEHSEILAFLRCLPHMDMDQIISEAYNIKEEISTQGLL